MKQFVIFITFFILAFSSSMKAQVELEWSNSGSADRTKRVLLVPFDPKIYFNDATSIIAPIDGSTHDELMLYFREEFNLQLYNAMMDSCVIINLLSDNTRKAQEDISQLYSIIGYELRLAMQNAPEDPDEVDNPNFFQRRRAEKEEQKKLDEMQNSRTRIENGEIVGKRQAIEDKYLHIVFHQPEVLAEIAKRRDVDLFLFINEFNIKGNYGDPYLSGNSKGERTIKVHFSLYNAQGKLVHGSFGETTIPFNLDDKEEITNNYFPEVIRQIVHNIDF